MDNLITWAESQTEEVRHWYRRNKVCKSHKTAYFMHSFWWISCNVEMLLWSNNIDILSIIDYLAQEWYILEREDCDILLNQVISQYVLSLKIKTSLTKYSSNISSVFQVRFDLFEDLNFGVCW